MAQTNHIYITATISPHLIIRHYLIHTKRHTMYYSNYYSDVIVVDVFFFVVCLFFHIWSFGTFRSMHL